MQRVVGMLFALFVAGFFRQVAHADVRVTETDATMEFRNATTILTFSRDGRSLVSFQYGKQEFVQVPSPVYEILLVKEDGETVRVTSRDAVSGEAAFKRGGGAVDVTVRGRLRGKATLDVTLRALVDETPFTKWRIHVQNNGPFAIRSITCPVVAVPLGLGGQAATVDPGPNLVLNPGFEDGLNQWSRTSLRKGEGDRLVGVAIDQQTFHSGKASARLAVDFEDNAQIYCPAQDIKVLPETDYLLVAYLKTELIAGTIHVELQDTRGWRHLCRMSIRLSEKNDWQRIPLSFRTSKETTAVRIGLRHIGSANDKKPLKGRVWLDDLSLARATDWSAPAQDDFVVYAGHDGKLVPAPGTRGGKFGGRYPGASMQVIAYYDKDAGIYLATHDATGQVKELSLTGGGEAMLLAARHLVPERAGADVAIEYDTVLGGFTGDWHTVGDIYAQWARKQWWCKTKWLDRSDVAEWVKKWPPMIKLDRYRKVRDKPDYEALATITGDFSKLLNCDVATFFHGWGQNGWQMGAARRLPHPPWGGEEMFRKSMGAIRAAGGRPFVFIMTDYALEAAEGKPVPYNDRETFAKEAAPFSKMGFDGKTLLRQYKDKHFLARMCPTTDYWRQCLVNKTGQLVRLGVPFVQFDCFPCTTVQPCYDPKHGHPLGYGAWWFDGYRDILNACRVKGKSLSPEFAMATEEMCEVFIPNLDFYMNRAHSVPRSGHSLSVPLFTYVYHEYLPPYAGEGNGTTLTSSPGKPSSPFNYRGIALSLLWGRLFTLRFIGPYDKMHMDPQLLDLTKRAHTAARTYAYDYAVGGRMLRPLPVKSDSITFKYWRWWTKPGSSAHFTMSTVFTAAWQSQTGTPAAFFVNVTPEERTIEVALPRANMSVALRRNGVREERTFAAKTVILKMKPLEILMLEYQ